MNERPKILLPSSLYESLENIENLDPKEMKEFLMTLRRYCDSIGKDYSKVCQELGLEEPSWSGKLKPAQVKALDEGTSAKYSWDAPGKWSINPETGRVDVEGDFICGKSPSMRNTSSLLGINFGEIGKEFDASMIGLKSLEGSPLEVRGNFNISRSKVPNLIGAPKKVSGYYNVSGNTNLISLEGSPDFVGGDINVSGTSIRSLVGGPSSMEGTAFSAYDCPNLSSLEGAPKNPDKSVLYRLEDCPLLYSLEGLPLEGKYRFSLKNNGLKSNVLENAFKKAQETKSWIVAYLNMFTDPDFIKTGKAPKDPIREKLAPDNIRKEIEENGERFVVGLKSIWNDFRVKKILRDIKIPEETRADADLLSALDDIGL